MKRVVYLVALALLLPLPSLAKSRKKDSGGALSQVVGGLFSKKKKKDSGGSRQRDYRGAGDQDDGDDYDRDDDFGAGDMIVAGQGLAASGLFLGVRAPSGQVDVDVTTDFQVVKDSDFALGSMIRASFENFTLSTAYTTYAEELPMDEVLAFTMWRVTGGYRIVSPGVGAITLDGGPTGAHARSLTMVGMVAGVTGRAAVANAVGVDAAARGYIYNEGSSAVELEVGARISVVRVGYRWTKFDVGPALEGPQLGLAFSF